MDNQLVPIVVEKDSRGFERSYDIYSRLLKDRIVFVPQGINASIANTIVAQLLFLQSEDDKADIYMYINCYGGEIYPSLAVYDTMQFLKPDVATIAVGTAMSMGAILLAGGAKGKRSALPNSTVLIHQPHGGTTGQTSDIEITAKESLRIKDKLYEILAKHTGQKKTKIEKDADRDYYMTAPQAREYGIIDKIITKAK